MAETTARDAKLIQYLSEAHLKEKELEQSLEAHIGMTTLSSQKAYKKRLREHLTETKRHARELERRIKKLGGDIGALASAVRAASAAAGRGMALAKGQAHALRGAPDEEKLLKNAKTEYFNEHEEIATYTAIEVLAEGVGDKDTAKLARAIRRDEERMARYLEGLIPRLTKAVMRTEIPARERSTASSRRRRSSSQSSGSRSTASRRKSGGSRSRSSSSRTGGSKSRSSSSRTRSSSARSRSSASRRSGSRRGGSSSR